MHNAPAVTYPVGRSLFHGGLVLAAGGLGSLIALLWLATPVALGWRQWLLVGVLVVVVVSASLAWRRSPRGVLRWDGYFWEWASSGTVQAGQLVVHVDLQSWMVVSLRSSRGGAVWLWPERRSDASHWVALRRAAFAHSGAGHHPDSSDGQPRGEVKA